MRCVVPLVAIAAAVVPSVADAQVAPNAAGARADTRVPPSPPATMTGEWGGLRTTLRDKGVDLAAGYASEAAWNAAGGQRERARETGQFIFGATIDTAKLIGLHGGTAKVTITYRRGSDLGAAAGLGVLQQVQEIYGRGQTWRLTQFWYDQKFAGDHADLKIGRLTQGEDFGAFSCQFMNLSFCGSPPGNLVGDYWYNWPVSQWAARLKVGNERVYAMAGVYEVNPRNLRNDFVLGHFRGATGVLAPVEIGYTPRVGARGLPGAYRFGGWYTTSHGNDLKLGVDRRARAITGVAPLRRDGRYGIYAQLQQQVSGTAHDGPDGPVATHGLVLFLNLTQADRRTSATDNQVAAGLFYTGLLHARPKDDFGLAFARTNVNARGVALLPPSRDGERPDAEYAAEIDYGLHVTDWLILRPNLQYVIDPSGYSHMHDVTIVGLKTSLTF